MDYKNTLCAVVLAIGSTGCPLLFKYDSLTGTVLSETGSVLKEKRERVRFENTPDPLFGSASVRVADEDPTYGLVLRGDNQNTYLINVESCDRIKLETLNAAINEGARVKISYRLMVGSDDGKPRPGELYSAKPWNVALVSPAPKKGPQ